MSLTTLDNTKWTVTECDTSEAEIDGGKVNFTIRNNGTLVKQYTYAEGETKNWGFKPCAASGLGPAFRTSDFSERYWFMNQDAVDDYIESQILPAGSVKGLYYFNNYGVDYIGYDNITIEFSATGNSTYDVGNGVTNTQSIAFAESHWDLYVPATYTITTNLINATADASNPTTIQEEGDVELTFSANTGYTLSNNVEVTGAEYEWEDGSLYLWDPTENVTVKIIGLAPGTLDNTRWKVDCANPLTYITGMGLYSVASYTLYQGTTPIISYTYDETHNTPDNIYASVKEDEIFQASPWIYYRPNHDTETIIYYLYFNQFTVDYCIQLGMLPEGSVKGLYTANDQGVFTFISDDNINIELHSTGNDTMDQAFINNPEVVYYANNYWQSYATSYSITPTLTNVTGSASNPTTITSGGTATLTFTANQGYSLPNSVTVTGATGTWNNGTLVLSNPTGNVTFSIAGIAEINEISKVNLRGTTYNLKDTTARTTKQDTLVSGTNIKTINNQTILGPGNIDIQGGVQSVNGKTGVVTLDATDVGALPSSTAIPTKTSDLQNDGDGTNPFLTTHQSLSAYRTASAQDVIDLGLQTDIDNIEEVIPSQASSSNQLADKNFVNSSISTSTATFRGTSATGLTEQQFIAWANSLTHDENDYVFWNTTDTDGNVQFKRYKYDGTQWLYEYTLNNSSFTANQWATIQSGLSSSDKTKLDGIESGAEVNTLEGVKIANTDLTITDKKVNIPYASGGSAGVIYSANNYGTDVLAGALVAINKTYSDYQSANANMFIGKGTLENVLDNESVRVDKAQSLTDTQKDQSLTNIGVDNLCININDEELEQGNITDTGAETTTTSNIRNANYISINPSTQYFYKAYSSLNNLRYFIAYYDLNKTFISRVEITNNSVITTLSNAYYLRTMIFMPTGTISPSNITGLSLNYPSTETSYHKYRKPTGYINDVVRGYAQPKEKNYELIEDVTLTQDVASFTRSSYNFKSLYFEVITPQYSTAGSLYGTINGAYSHYGPSAISTSASGGKEICFADIHYGRLKVMSQGGGNSPYTTTSLFSYFGGQGLETSAINSFNIVATGAGLIPSGTNIKIYGVRN